MRTRWNNLLAALLGCISLGTLPEAACAVTYIVYFDVSSSVRAAHGDYVTDYIKFARANFKTGDVVLLHKLEGHTQQFSPFQSVKIPLEDPRRSSTVNSRARENAVYDTYANVKVKLAEAVPKDETCILGAFTSARAYFSQEKVPEDSRTMVIFTDGIEECSHSGIFMKKGIPKPTGKAMPKTVDDLRAKIYMIGIDTKKLPPRSDAALETFWDAAVKATGSTTVVYRQRLGE